MAALVVAAGMAAVPAEAVAASPCTSVSVKVTIDSGTHRVFVATNVRSTGTTCKKARRAVRFALRYGSAPRRWTLSRSGHDFTLTRGAVKVTYEF